MKPPLRPLFRQRTRGSNLIVVMMFTAMMLLLVGSVLGWSVNERLLTLHQASLTQARNAAEAVTEYGCYQVATAFNTQMNPSFGSGSNGTTSISFPTSLASTFFANTNVVTTSLTITAGNVTQVPASSLYYVDPADPNNQYDPLVGRYVYRRDVTVLGKATVIPPNGGGSPVTAYIQEQLSIRGAPLFSYAIFYSGNDMEFGESPLMSINGPVHVNGNLFVGPVSTNALSFYGQVTAAGNVFHAWRGTSSTDQEGGNSISTTTPVYFSTNTADTTTASMRTTTGSWEDSTMGADSGTSGLSALAALVTTTTSTNFSKYASQTWNGQLQSASMGVQSYNPMGYSEIVGYNTTTSTNILATDPLADNGANVNTGAGYGHGYGPHSLIEPPLAVPSTDTYASAKTSIEQQKLANNAGIYINVTVTATNAATLQVYGDPNSAPAGTPASNLGPNGGLLLGTVPSNVVQFIPYTTTGSGSNLSVSSGIYDQQQQTGVNLIQVNVASLSTALTDMTSTSSATANADFVTTTGSKWGSGTTGGFNINTSGSTGWNGGIYIGVTNSSSNMAGVVISRGVVTNSHSSMVPTGTSSPNSVTGLTIATNMPVYILGSYNADGKVGAVGTATNSAVYPDDGQTGAANDATHEVPCAIAADSISVLSGNYFGTASSTTSQPYVPTTNSSTSSSYGSYKNLAPNASYPSEIAAAFITGVNSTTSVSSGTQQYSGGVHNLPRFLETWNSNTVAIRGSLVTMYNSRVATKAWSQSYYGAPPRQWGFDSNFANGNFPPICPKVISYRRVNFAYLTSVSYSAVASGL